MGDEEMIGIGGDAKRRQPQRHRLAMPGQALMRQIAEQVRHLAIGKDFRERGRDHVVLAGIGRYVQRQIDRRVRMDAAARLGPPPLHERPASDFARN